MAGNEAAVHREKLPGDVRDPRGLSLGGLGVQHWESETEVAASLSEAREGVGDRCEAGGVHRPP